MIPDLLRGAANVIDTSGWARCKDIDSQTGGVCANGALRVAAGHTTTTDEFGRMQLAIPTDMPYEVAQERGRQIAAAHSVLTEYLGTVHQYNLATMVSCLPSIIRYNDNIAQTGGEVAGIMRAAAAWVESHPERELAAVEQVAHKAHLFPQFASTDTAILASAYV